jgi:hypothetical protein
MRLVVGWWAVSATAGRSVSASVPAACGAVAAGVVVALPTEKVPSRSFVSGCTRRAAPNLERIGKNGVWDGLWEEEERMKRFEFSLVSPCQCLARLDWAKLGSRSDNARMGPGASRLLVVRCSAECDNRRSRDVLRFCGWARRWLCCAHLAADHPLSMGRPCLYSAAPHFRDASS